MIWGIPPVCWDFPEEIPEEFRKDPGNALRAFPGIRLKSTAGIPKPYNSRHLRLPEHFQNSLPPSTAGDASFFRIGSGEGLSEPLMEFPAVLGVFLMISKSLRFGSLRSLPVLSVLLSCLLGDRDCNQAQPLPKQVPMWCLPEDVFSTN